MSENRPIWNRPAEQPPPGPGDFYAKHGTDHFDEGNGNALEAPGSNKDLSLSNLGAGETASGNLVFDMPAPHGRIAYAPNLDGQALGYWKY